MGCDEGSPHVTSLQARLKNHGSDSLWLAAIRTELRAEKKKEAEALVAKALQVRCRLSTMVSLCRDAISSVLTPRWVPE